MKPLLSLLVWLAITSAINAQVFPVIKSFGGIYDIPYATEKPDPDMTYTIVIDLASGNDPGTLNQGLNNVARMINLHAVGGVPPEKISVVVAIHNEATYSTLSNEAHKALYGKENVNAALYQELSRAGVQFFVCGQSLTGRGVNHQKLLPEIKVATSMLTVLTTYQQKGYAWFKF